MEEQDFYNVIEKYELQLIDGCSFSTLTDMFIPDDLIKESVEFREHEMKIVNLAKSIRLLRGCSNPEMTGEINQKVKIGNRTITQRETLRCTLEQEYNTLLLQQMEQDLNNLLEAGSWKESLQELGECTDRLNDEQIEYLIYNIENNEGLFSSIATRTARGAREGLYIDCLIDFGRLCITDFESMKSMQQHCFLYDLAVSCGIIEPQREMNNQEKYSYIRERLRTWKRNIEPQR